MLTTFAICFQTIYLLIVVYDWNRKKDRIEELEEKDRKRTELFKIYAEITQNEIQELDKNIKCFKENQDHKISQGCMDSLKSWESDRKRIENSFEYIRPPMPVPMYQHMALQGSHSLYDPSDLLNCCKRY